MLTVAQHIDEVLRRTSAPSNAGARREAEFYWDRLDDHERYRLQAGLLLGTRPLDAWCSFIERRAIEDRIRRAANSEINYGRFAAGPYYP